MPDSALSPAIKICGITDTPALDAAIGARADFVGLNFYPPSPRFLDSWAANALAMRGGSRIGRVGLFVDADDEAIGEALRAASLDAIQLHGSETPERAAQVKARFGVTVWKVIAVSGAKDVARADDYAGHADLILFDARTPGGALPGGMGLRFDWSLLSRWKGRPGWGLAGGLTLANVGEAVALTGAPLVDTASGVESAPGIKDVDKIAAFCKAARQS
jgi:phosphoribosylanthranilate isomerase